MLNRVEMKSCSLPGPTEQTSPDSVDAGQKSTGKQLRVRLPVPCPMKQQVELTQGHLRQKQNAAITQLGDDQPEKFLHILV